MRGQSDVKPQYYYKSDEQGIDLRTCNIRRGIHKTIANEVVFKYDGLFI